MLKFMVKGREIACIRSAVYILSKEPHEPKMIRTHDGMVPCSADITPKVLSRVQKFYILCVAKYSILDVDILDTGSEVTYSFIGANHHCDGVFELQVSPGGYLLFPEVPYFTNPSEPIIDIEMDPIEKHLREINIYNKFIGIGVSNSGEVSSHAVWKHLSKESIRDFNKIGMIIFKRDKKNKDKWALV